jgi:serine/threonine protein kinase
MLSHPGISRLVSSFRFRDGAYLVLEYASGGDLHTLLKENGSLNEESTRFVVGELVAALYSIHELDLVYVDLKPENILITESGHVKITDFGGCRPLTDKAKETVRRAGQNLIKNLRDGDWRISKDFSNANITTAGSTSEINPMEDEEQQGNKDNNDCHFDDDYRIEGTTAYLPPELILGGYPTISTDSWALGCVFYQCLAGRPPLLEDNESSTRRRIVSFDIGGESHSSLSSKEDDFFTVRGGINDGNDNDNATTFSSDAKDLIKQLLSRNPKDRPTMMTISEHTFFSSTCTDVFGLYKESSCRLDAGRITPRPEAQWTRRQFSSIWAPQPQAYNISSGIDTDLSSGNRSGKDISANGPIPEGDESEGFFLSKQIGGKRPMLVGIREK